MFILGNFIQAVAYILDIILSIAWWLILIRALISWVNPDPFNPIVQFLYRTTEPILQPIRRFMPRITIDFSPIVAWLFIAFLRRFLIQSLYVLSLRLQ